MGLFYVIIAISFVVLFIVNTAWMGYNLYLWSVNGIQFLLQGRDFVESIYASSYLKWVLLADVMWLFSIFGFVVRRKNYKTDVNLHYLIHKPIKNPKICVSMHAFNEELGIEKCVNDFKNQKNVETVIVVDNHSTDKTVEIAEKCGATVITKDSNKGYAHSWFLGLREALKTDANIIVITDVDGTFSGYDISKMISYLDNCDMVVGTRLVQTLTEKGNQNGAFYVWGNRFIAFLLQLKYFSFMHLGVIQLTDVGCSYRCIRKEALEKILDKFTYPDSDRLLPLANNSNPPIVMTMIGIANNLRIIEIPISFKKRIGKSKYSEGKKLKGIKYGLEFIWIIIRN